VVFLFQIGQVLIWNYSKLFRTKPDFENAYLELFHYQISNIPLLQLYQIKKQNMRNLPELFEHLTN